MSDNEISEKLKATNLDDILEDDFSTLPKKKKSSKKVAFEDEIDPTESKENDEFDAELEDSNANSEETAQAKASDVWQGSDRDYSFNELLGRFYSILRENNPELAGEKRKYTIVPPQIVRDGNKKSIFANLPDICKRMHRPPEHVIQYLFSELGTSGSVDGNGALVIKGRFQQKQIENVLRRYIMEYVTCKTCKSGETILTKENRLYFIQCESCGSTRSVAQIKTGFQAQTVKRSVARRAAA
ncbi:hypothetical protein BB558_004040 [Smittium angustum]|uniref:Translation initiation factor IF2/IF5 domain-containing protein n=1 Tax=Smittium angustum TaxID=133377 RepID=A0A2U1J4I6_SMIAN|nr:hypothetical protein BB558_004040 [Smittium angustum]